MNEERREQIERTFRKSLVKALEVFDEEARVLDTFAEGKDEGMDASYRKLDEAIAAAYKVRYEAMANAELCSGSTGDFESLNPGSNPGSAARKVRDEQLAQIKKEV